MTVVIKLGGGETIDPDGLIIDIAHLTANGTPVVVVHGGSTTIDQTIEALGRAPTYIETPEGIMGRFTDEATMQAVTMALARVNTNLVTRMQEAGINALGLHGVDGGLLKGPRTDTVRVIEDGRKMLKRGDHSGRIQSVNTELLDLLIDGGYIPVITLPMLGVDGESLTAVNADADRVAGAIAAALEAPLVILTDVPGVMHDTGDASSLIDQIRTSQSLREAHKITHGFMTRKVMAATESLEQGAQRVVIADANVNSPVVEALDGSGTIISPSAVGRMPEGEEVHLP